MSDRPEAKVELVETQFESLWRLRKCPLCGEEHRHNAGRIDENPRDFLGPVVGHCRPGTQGAPDGYILVEDKAD
jgi:hypothetical protein